MGKLSNTIKIKKHTLTTLVTLLGIVIFYLTMTGMDYYGFLSNSMAGMLITICSYSMLAVSLNLVVGILGELSLGHAGFMYIGAFTGVIFTQLTAISIENDMLRFVLGLLVGGVFAAAFGLLIGSAVLRLHGDYLAIVTLAFGEIIRSVLGTVYLAFDSRGFHFSLKSTTELIKNQGVSSEDILVKGPQGINGIDRFSTFFIGIVLLIITVLVVMNLSDSRSGRAIKAVRDNKIAAETVGIHISKFRLLAFTISAALAGVAGVFYAHGMTTLTNAKYDYNYSISFLVMVVLGGMGSVPGSIIAAVLLTILPEKLRFIGDYRMIIYSLVLIIMMIFSWNPTLIEFRKKVTGRIKSFIPTKKTAKEVQ